jgi:hypothetical protein
MLACLQRQALLAPGPLARALAVGMPDRRARWMLCRPRRVRRSFAEAVLGRPREEIRAAAWMLAQDDDLRASYVRDVLGGCETRDQRAQRWMLGQPDLVRRAFVAVVLAPELDEQSAEG